MRRLLREDLVAIEEIKQLKARYFRLLDAQSWEEWAEVYTLDAVIDVSDDTGSVDTGIVRGRTQIVEGVSAMLTGARTTHHGHTPEIEIVDETHATGIWAMQDTVDLSAVGEPPQGIRGTGWYHETYRRTDGVWQIASMRLERISVEPLT